MGKKYNKKASKDDIFRILDTINVLQEYQKEDKTLYVPKKSYKIAKSLIRSIGKEEEIKIKTY